MLFVLVPILPAFLYEMQHPNESKLKEINISSTSPPRPTPQVIIINPCNETIPSNFSFLTDGEVFFFFFYQLEFLLSPSLTYVINY